MCEFCRNEEHQAVELEGEEAGDRLCGHSDGAGARSVPCRARAKFEVRSHIVVNHLCEDHALERRRSGLIKGDAIREIDSEATCNARVIKFMILDRGACGKPARYAQTVTATSRVCAGHND